MDNLTQHKADNHLGNFLPTGKKKKPIFKIKAMNNLILILGLLLLGMVAGYFSGLVGIGGGIIIVPVLVLMFGFSQHAAQGTTLALLIPPIGILAVLSYYQKGYVDVKSAIIICIGFFIGGYLGGKMAIGFSEELLKKIFAIALVTVGVVLFITGK